VHEGLDLDLGMVAAKPVEWLLAALFDPNAAIEPRYQAQILKLKSGAEFTGLVVADARVARGWAAALRLTEGGRGRITRVQPIHGGRPS
jgi:hypothetical protein